MRVPGFLKRMIDAALARRGSERIPSRLVYPWQREAVDLPSHSGAPLPEGAEARLRADHPRLAELARRYGELDSPWASAPICWTPAHVATADLRQFRGDNLYVHQLRGRNMNEIGYAVSYYCVRRCARSSGWGSSTGSTRMGSSACTPSSSTAAGCRAICSTRRSSSPSSSATSASRRVPRADDSRHRRRLRPARPPRGDRLPGDRALPLHRRHPDLDLSLRVLPRLPRALAGDRAPARVVPLHELESAIQPGEVDIAVNIHSFSECPPTAIDAWLAFLARKRVAHLMIVPNAPSMAPRLRRRHDADQRRPGLQPDRAPARLQLVASEPKFPDPRGAGVRHQPGRAPALPPRHLIAVAAPSVRGETTQAADRRQA